MHGIGVAAGCWFAAAELEAAGRLCITQLLPMQDSLIWRSISEAVGGVRWGATVPRTRSCMGSPESPPRALSRMSRSISEPPTVVLSVCIQQCACVVILMCGCMVEEQLGRSVERVRGGAGGIGGRYDSALWE